jgi:Flp pilus assembly protein CpaB
MHIYTVQQTDDAESSHEMSSIVLDQAKVLVYRKTIVCYKDALYCNADSIDLAWGWAVKRKHSNKHGCTLHS